MNRRLFLSLSQTNGVLAEVINGVPPAQEGISQDDKGADRLGEVHALEGGDAATRDLQDVVVSGNAEVVARESKGDVGELVTLGALNRVLAVVTLLGTNLLVEQLSKSRGEDVQGSAGVKDGTVSLKVSGLVAKGNGIEVNLPVSLAAEGDVGDLALVVRGIEATKGSLALITFLVGVAEVEGEDRLVNSLLVNKVVEGGNNLVDGNGVVTKTEDTVEAAEGKGKAGLASSLGKVLLLDLKVANGDVILGDETSQAARAVVDLELGAVGLVGRRRRRVVLGVQVACNAAALLGRNPQVGATSVQDNLEGLGRSTDLDLGEV